MKDLTYTMSNDKIKPEELETADVNTGTVDRDDKHMTIKVLWKLDTRWVVIAIWPCFYLRSLADNGLESFLSWLSCSSVRSSTGPMSATPVSTTSRRTWA